MAKQSCVNGFAIVPTVCRLSFLQGKVVPLTSVLMFKEFEGTEIHAIIESHRMHVWYT